MGYYTKYHLTLELQEGVPTLLPQCCHLIPDNANFCPECGQQVKSYPIETMIWETINGSEDYYGLHEPGEAFKWYQHDKAMRALSRHFPLVLFILRGEGEETGDLWQKYYLDGRCQVAKVTVTYTPFDISKLDSRKDDKDNDL